MARLQGSVDQSVALLGKRFLNPMSGRTDRVVELIGENHQSIALLGRIDKSVSLNGDTFKNEMLQGLFDGTALSGSVDVPFSLYARKDLAANLSGDFGVGFSDPWVIAKGKWQDWGRWFDIANWIDQEV